MVLAEDYGAGGQAVEGYWECGVEGREEVVIYDVEFGNGGLECEVLGWV